MNNSLFNITLDNLSGAMMLSIEPKEPVVINDFCCEMIKKTDVYGLLRLNVTTIDGNIKFNYDVSNKKTIAEFAKTGFTESYGRRILYNLCMSFLKLNEYYLKPNYCLLSPEYTYVGDGLNVYLPYIPIKDAKTDSNELKKYFSELLSKYFAVEGIAAYDEMFKYVFQCQTLDLSHFISKFLASEEQSQNNFIAEKQNKMANKMPLPNANNVPPNSVQRSNIQNQQKPVNNLPPKAPANPNVPQGGFKMPGGGGVKMPGSGDMKVPGGGGFKMPGGGEMKAPNPGGGFKMPGGGIKMPFGNGAPQKPENKGIFGFGNKKQNPPQQFQQPIQNKPSGMPNQNVPNGGFQQFQQPQNNNVPPRFANGYQSSMDKTIMIDNANSQMQNQQMGGGMAYLQYRGQNIPINDSEFVIGKANNQYKVNFAINDNPRVSRKHASIIAQGNSYFIRDEGSTNGTYVNGRLLPKMVPQPLQNGDEISIYDEVFKFCM